MPVQIQALRANYAHDFGRLLERLSARYGEEPLSVWEKRLSEPFLFGNRTAAQEEGFGGMLAGMATKGTRVRARQVNACASMACAHPACYVPSASL
jgi:hypothetical protein